MNAGKLIDTPHAFTTDRPDNDICFILEGTYPYVLGGVSGWLHELLKALQDKKIAVVAVMPTRKDLAFKYDVPKNITAVQNIFLDDAIPGRPARSKDLTAIRDIHALMRRIILDGDSVAYEHAKARIEESGLGHDALLHSRQAWTAILEIYEETSSVASLLQFFWTWRSLVSGVMASMFCNLPDASLYHAISTGYAGLVGARIAQSLNRPYLITEHGIYTNERRIELNVADWLFDSGRAGFSVENEERELRDLWLSAFSSFARFAYDQADEITTLYEGNQLFQIADGAPQEKLKIIPNGVDVDRFKSARAANDEDTPTVALIGRVVPIKDIRMFIAACGELKKTVPNAKALILGPHEEDPEYAEQCLSLVKQLELEDMIEFCGRVNIIDYLPQIHVLALTSLSEAQPLVLLEAGAAGIPSITTDVGSCREIIEGFHGDTVKGVGGRVVDCADSTAAGKAMSEILLDADLRKSMGAVMQERVMTTYNKTKIDARYRELYDFWIQTANARRAEDALNQPAPPANLTKPAKREAKTWLA